MEINFDFGLRDNVKIKALGVSGLVVGVYYGETGKQYQVSYAYEGDFKTVYLFNEQLEKLFTPVNELYGFLK